jgi:hypothetical protein
MQRKELIGARRLHQLPSSSWTAKAWAGFECMTRSRQKRRPIRMDGGTGQTGSADCKFNDTTSVSGILEPFVKVGEVRRRHLIVIGYPHNQLEVASLPPMISIVMP